MVPLALSINNLKRLPATYRLLPTLVAVGIVLTLTVVVVLTRLYRLSEIPPGIINDEGANGVDALRVLHGEHAVFFAERASGREAMAVYATALATRLLGPSLLSFHLPGALASAATVFVVFVLGMLLFGRDSGAGKSNLWRGLIVAGIGAGLLAGSLGQTFLARGGFRANFLPLVLSLSLALLWWAWRKSSTQGGSWWWLALSGACAGLLPYTYIPARFTPLLFTFLGLSFLIPLRPATITIIRANWKKACLFTVAAGLVAAPILVYFILNPNDFFFRSKEISLTQNGQRTVWAAFLTNAMDYLLVFGVRGDRIWEYNFAGRPLLNAWEALFFWTGVGMSLWRWRQRPAYRLLVIWLAVLILPAMLTFNRGLGPNSLRIIGAAPAAFLLVGVGMWETTRLAKLLLPNLNRTLGAALVGTTIVSLITVQGVSSFRTYFHEWLGTPSFYAAADAELAEVASVLNVQGADSDTVYLIPYSLSNGHFGFDYLYQGEAPAHVIHATTTHLPQNIQAILNSHHGASTVKVIDWNDDLSWIGGGEEHTLALLQKYGTHLASRDYPYFQIHTFSDVSLESNWTFYDELGPPIVNYDGGISLLGIALGHGESQHPIQQPVDLGMKRSFWMAMQWQTAPKLQTEYAISLRLHNDKGSGVYQKDIVLLNPNRSRTNDWSPDNPVEMISHIEIPHHLESGQYELRLVVYDYETLKPTVELGVWEPEAVLTRFQISRLQ